MKTKVNIKTKVKNGILYAFPKNVSLTNGAIGLLASMTNVPERDYKTFDEILKFNNVDTPETIKPILDELIESGFLIHPNDNPEIYAVNKFKLIDFELLK